jgi:hypothetical protein
VLGAGCIDRPLILHADNGSPQTGSTLMATLERLAMRACDSLRAGDLPVELSVFSSARSASVSVTLYFCAGTGFSSLVSVSRYRLETLHEVPS